MVQKNSGNCASPKNIPELSSFNKKQNPFNSQASHDISGPSCFITPSLMAEKFWDPLDLDQWSGFGEKSGQTNKQSHKDTKIQSHKATKKQTTSEMFPIWGFFFTLSPFTYVHFDLSFLIILKREEILNPFIV